MIKLSITAFASPITVQDPRPVTQNNEEQAVITVEANTTSSIDMQWGQLERVGQQLSDLAAIGMCTFNIDQSSTPGFVDQADAVDNPSLDLMSAAPAAAGSVGITLTGNKLAADGEKASAVVVSVDTAAGSVNCEMVVPGNAGNSYDVTVVDSGSGDLAVTTSVVDGRTIIEVDLGGSATEDCTSVAAAISGALTNIVVATVVGAGATLITAVQDVTPFTGGVGTGISVMVGGAAATITDVDVTADPVHVLTVTTPAVGSAGELAKILVRSNAKETLATAVLG